MACETTFYAAVPEDSEPAPEIYDIRSIGTSPDMCVKMTLALLEPDEVDQLFAVIEIPANIFVRAKMRGGRGNIPNIGS